MRDVMEDMRLRPMVLKLRELGAKELVSYPRSDGMQVNEYGDENPGLTLDNFEDYLKQSFPPCMKHLVYHQRTGRHLKFQGRLQLRPFLREAGLSLQSSLMWWKRELANDQDFKHADFQMK